MSAAKTITDNLAAIPLDPPLSFWIGFNLFVLFMLALDLGVFHRKNHEVKFKEALTWSGVWVILALLFSLLIYSIKHNHQHSLLFITGYLIEWSLSVDNLFVFLLIFSYFKVPAAYQHKVLFWGIIGALILRFIFIMAGVVLLNKFHWLIYIFGLILIVSGWKLFFEKGKEIHPEKNPVLRLFQRFFAVTPTYEQDKFWIVKNGVLFATPLLIVLIVVETTDVVFAVDSIPAILAITRDPFIVYTSNAFAILGLRSLFFVLSRVMELFHYLHYGLACILIFVGLKMILAEWIRVPTVISLAVILGTIVISIGASLPHVKKEIKT